MSSERKPPMMKNIRQETTMLYAWRQAVTQYSIFFLLLFFLCWLLVWDMQTQHEMSDIIHDDHHKQWVKINQSELSMWLSELDMCMLQVNSSDTDLHEYQQKNCAGLQSTGVVPQRLFCHIGSSLGKQCAPPLSTRTYFKSRLKDKHIGDPSNHYLNKALRQLALLKKSVLFLGDGISKQNQDALICELVRSEEITLLGTMRDEYRQLFHNLTILWPATPDSLPLQLDIIFMKMNKIIEQSNDAGTTEIDKEIDQFTNLIGKRKSRIRSRPRRKLTSNSTVPLSNNRTLEIETPDSTEINSDSSQESSDRSDANLHADVDADSSGVNPNSTEYVNQGKKGTLGKKEFNSINLETVLGHGFSLKDVKEEIEVIQRIYTGMVIIANTGVWYNSRERFRDEAPRLLNWLNNLGKSPNNLVFYRETSAQHYNFSEMGYFENIEDREKVGNGSCTPLLDSSPDYDWRNKDVANLIDNLELEYISIIPFRDITLPLHNMHPSNKLGQGQDCTHFCYFPQMWMSIWNHLYRHIIVSANFNGTVSSSDFSTSVDDIKL